MTLRIVDGNTTSGRLEVWRFGQWGTFCDYNFNDAAATVACRTLGLGNVGVKMAASASAVGPIWYDSVYCSSSSTSLWDCSMYYNGITTCSHSLDVGVACYQAPNGK